MFQKRSFSEQLFSWFPLILELLYLVPLSGMEPDRQQLIDLANAAKTPTQIKVAKAALKGWQADHPNDSSINVLLGDLSMREAQLRIAGQWH